MRIDPGHLRTCLGHFVTGVTVVTCEAEGAPHGATVNAFTAVSLDPPLVLVSLDNNTKICKYLDDRPFTVNVLNESQDELALHFAGNPISGPVRWERPYSELAPQLGESLATIACTPWRSYDGGDHVLYLGEVTNLELRSGEPLVFYRGEFRHVGAAFRTVPWLESADCPGLSWFPSS